MRASLFETQYSFNIVLIPVGTAHLSLLAPVKILVGLAWLQLPVVYTTFIGSRGDNSGFADTVVKTL